MKDIVVKFLIGFISGAIFTVGLIASDTRINAEQKQTELMENVSMQPPKELPKEIEFDEIKIPTNLTEVILWKNANTNWQ